MIRIIMIGYMGAGKTTVGRQLALALGCSFYDLDWYIEMRYHRTVAQIFAERGEEGFRELERNMLHEVAEFENIVLSCGGGTPCFFDNMEYMNSLGETVFLHVEPEVLATHLKMGKVERPLIKGKSEEELRKAFRTDPYYNALHVKYGYAITGHKSQGGEWDTVFVDYDRRLGLNNDSLRWAYTATTRASKHLYGHMLPNIQPFSGIKIAAITKASKAPAEAIRLNNPGDVVYLPENATNIQKAKCLSVKAALAMSSCTIVRIDTLNYNDRYTIHTPGGEETFDMFYGASGIYTTITPRQASTDYTPEILEALRSEQSYEYSDDYVPSLDHLGDLYRKMKSLCDDAGARITNVVEMMDKYRIVYHLKTSGAFSSITLSVKANGKVTSALPSSDLGAEDTILNAILENLK